LEPVLDEVVAAQRRLGGLLRANRLIGGEATLTVVLYQIVSAACELVEAPHGELRVCLLAGEQETVIQVGAELAGPEDLTIEVKVRGVAAGVLRLSGHDLSATTAEDVELLGSLAATAGVAIDNARLIEDLRQRQDWLQASAEITRQLLNVDGEDPLRVIAHELQRVAAADAVNVALPVDGGQRISVKIATGAGADVMTGSSYPMAGTVSELVIERVQAILIDDMAEVPARTVHLAEVTDVGPLMVLPLVGVRRVRGVLIVGRLRGRRHFAAADLDMAAAFANQVAVALELDDARSDQERLSLFEDRDRIARDLHDHVIQRLFGVGLTVSSVASLATDVVARTRLDVAVQDIDETIREIRASIYRLHDRRSGG
jgi:signal transduction histidine kinase